MTTAAKAKKVEKSHINYKIDSTLIDKLYNVRLKLRKDINYGYSVAGLCLLGEKNGIIDDYVPIISKNGCYDSPTISYSVFESAFLKMIKKDRTVLGMALIRPEGYNASLPNDFRSNIRNWKNAFKDLSNTVWIVVSEKEVIPYSVKKDSINRIKFRRCRKKIFNNPEDSKMLRISEIRHKMRNLHSSDTSKMTIYLYKLAKTIEIGTSGAQIIKNIEEEKKTIEKKKRERLDKLKKQRETRIKRKKRAQKLFKEQEEKAKRRKNQEKAGMKDVEDIGGGYFLIKAKNEKEILWKK